MTCTWLNDSYEQIIQLIILINLYLHVELWWGEYFSSLRWWPLPSPTVCPSLIYEVEKNTVKQTPFSKTCKYHIYDQKTIKHATEAVSLEKDWEKIFLNINTKWTAHLFMMNRACRLYFITSTFFIASTVKDESST